MRDSAGIEAKVDGNVEFAQQAAEFKRVLTRTQPGVFTADEMAAMLGSFVLAVYYQRFLPVVSPDQAEFMQKNTLLAERLIEDLSE